jgi:mannosyl-glycoprotein endo-beta-N-acetylglucosaminidase
MKRALLPTFCFAVLSTVAFEETVLATQNETVVSEKLDKPTTRYVNVTSGFLNLRESAATNANVVATLIKGTKVTVYSEANDWSKVRVNGKEGYVSSNYLSSTKAESSSSSKPKPETSTKYVNVNSGSLNLRESASTSAAIVTSLKKGTAVTVVSEANDWFKVKANGKEGYVSSSYLTTKQDISSPSTSSFEPTTKYVTVNSGSLNVRKSATTNASIIVKLANGKEVKVYSESNGWAKVEVFGQVGYVSSQYISSTKPSKNNRPSSHKTTTKYVNVSTGSGLNIRKTASLNGTVLLKLAKGTEVTVYSEANGWAKIKVDGQEGYVSVDYLTATKPGSNPIDQQEQTLETKYVSVGLASSLIMRNGASTNSSIIVKLPRGMEITVYSEANGWSKVKAYGQMGYVN